MSFMRQQFDEFNRKIESIFNELKLVQLENEQIKKENIILSKELSEIRHKIDILEHQNLGASVEIIGIPITENKNCISIVKQIGKKMNIDIPVIGARRITTGKSNSNLTVAKLESKEKKFNLFATQKTQSLTLICYYKTGLPKIKYL